MFPKGKQLLRNQRVNLLQRGLVPNCVNLSASRPLGRPCDSSLAFKAVQRQLSNSAEHRSVGGLLSWSWSLCSYSAKMNVCSFLQPWTRRRWKVLQEMMLSGSQVCRQAYDMCALNCLRLSVMWKSLSGKDLKVKPKSIFMIWDFLQQWLGQPLPSVASTVLASDVLRHTGTVFYHTRSCRQ